MLEKFIKKPCEDSLTASVFSHLLHLPIEDFWRILQNACFSDRFPDNPGEPICIHAWPQWNASGTCNSERVIPDLVIGFCAFDLIIEAKRWDVAMQDRGQWESGVHSAKARRPLNDNYSSLVKLNCRSRCVCPEEQFFWFI